MKLNAIIVDDEIKGAKSLEILLNSINSEVEVKEIALNALDGIKAVKKYQPDILFLDINMPVHSGFEVLDHIDRGSIYIVFTTAHDEYAIKAIREKAFDYLLKPVDPDLLMDCIGRVITAKQNLTAEENKQLNNNQFSQRLCISVKDGMLIIHFEKIIRIQGSGSYSIIFIDGGEKHMVSQSIGELEKQLETTSFFRCHNSHIINLKKVIRFIRADGNFIEMEDNSRAEISKNRKQELLQRLNIK